MLKERLKEPSTWAGLGIALPVIGQQLGDLMPIIGNVVTDYKNPIGWLTLFSAVVAIVQREKAR